MNTKAIGAASEVICRAMSKDRLPATIAVALDANGLLAGPEVAALTRELRAEVDELRTQLEIAERQNAELAAENEAYEKALGLNEAA
jgi:hypothetical protein